MPGGKSPVELPMGNKRRLSPNYYAFLNKEYELWTNKRTSSELEDDILWGMRELKEMSWRKKDENCQIGFVLCFLFTYWDNLA